MEINWNNKIISVNFCLLIVDEIICGLIWNGFKEKLVS